MTSASGARSHVKMTDALRGEMTGEGATAAEDALYFKLGAVALEYVFHDGEAETGTARGARTACIDTVKPFRQTRNMLCGNAHTRVGH